MKQCLVAVIVVVLSMVFVAGCAGPGSPIITPTTPETSSEMPDSGFFLTVTQPINESIINTDKVKVIGITVPRAVVSVNGELANLDEEGNFTMMVFLEEGPNSIEVTASDIQGNQESHSLVIIYVPSDITETSFFLTVTQPVDSSTTNSDKVEVKGRTSLGAVVSVNGELAEVDDGGSFTTMVVLEEGPNLIEVIASDLEGNQESRTLVIMYVP
jgi:bacillopeptidase F